MPTEKVTDKEDLSELDIEESGVSDDLEDADGKENRIYEIGFHILPSVPEENLPEEFQEIKNIIENNSSKIVSEEFPKEKALAYTIYKEIDGQKAGFNKAFFGWIKFQAVPGSLSGMKKKVEEKKNILRFILVKTVKENTLTSKEPSVDRLKPSPKKDTGIYKSKDNPEDLGDKVSEEELDKSIDKLVETK